MQMLYMWRVCTNVILCWNVRCTIIANSILTKITEGYSLWMIRIFQEAFIKLWENIESKKIYAEDGVLKGKDRNPFTSSLTTYFMGIARLKYLEWVREKMHVFNSEDI